MHLAAIFESMLRAIANAGSWFPGAWHSFSRTAAAIAATALWQGVAVAVGLIVCLRFAPRMSAAHRFAVWTAGFAALVVLPFLPLLSHFTRGAAHGVPAGLSEAAAQPWIQLNLRWGLVIAALWAAASALRAVDLAIHSLRLRRLWKAAVPVESSNRELTPRLAGMWGRRQVRLCTTQQLERPSVIGFFAPRILIPEWLYARLTPGELDQIVLHETEHLRRRDDWTNLFQKLCLVLFPLNPALWWIERRLCREREMACDEGVVRVTRAPRAYAACLTSLAERGLQRRAEALSLGAWHRRPELAHRVHSILRRGNGLSPLAANALLGVVGCGLLFGSVELARCPQLVAFVPARAVGGAHALASTMPQARTARLIRTAFAPVPRSGKARAALRRHAAKIEPGPAKDHPAEMAMVQAPLQRTAQEAPAAIEAKAASPTLASSSSRQSQQVMAKAEMPDSRIGSAQGQQWIVFTAWEQVQTSNPNARQAASDGLGKSVGVHPAGSQESGQQPVQPVSQYTVTRLILRVYPVNSASKPSAITAFRDGWLVIQL